MKTDLKLTGLNLKSKLSWEILHLFITGWCKNYQMRMTNLKNNKCQNMPLKILVMVKFLKFIYILFASCLSKEITPSLTSARQENSKASASDRTLEQTTELLRAMIRVSYLNKNKGFNNSLIKLKEAMRSNNNF